MSQKNLGIEETTFAPNLAEEIERQQRISEKLAGIATAGLGVIPETYEAGGKRVPTDFYTVTTWPTPENPLRPGVRFHAEKGSDEILLWEIDLGDEELEGHGIGSLMLPQIVQYHNTHLRRPVRVRRLPGKTTRQHPLILRRQRGNLAFMRALDRVAGRENISFMHDGVRYGRNEELPFEAVLSRQALLDMAREKPEPEEGQQDAEEFSVYDVEALVIPERFLSVNIPVRLAQIATAAKARHEALQARIEKEENGDGADDSDSDALAA
ncbi:MAG TPA: hypothetical protein VHB72_00365 [Candidatus Saccharimonadales bacterium]|nr:hypothetical protein [Candidatus Saccharimonadales bacterium]